MSVTREALLFSAAVGVVVGAFGVLIAARERESGASWWAWVVPGGSGVLLLILSLLKLVGVA